MTPDTIRDFATSIRFAFGATDLILGLMVICFAIGTIWSWKEDNPKSERFWFICGIFFHWLATIDNRTIDLLREGGSIQVRTAHILTSFNLILVFVAGIFYTRALTQHVWPDFWRKIMQTLVVVAFVLFGLMMWITW